MAATSTIASVTSSGSLESGDAGTVACPGVMAMNAGTSSAGSAPVIASPGFASGTAAQLTDLARDYVVYFTIGTGGGTVTIAVGPTNATATTLVNAAAGVNGAVIPVRLPAGWFLKITVVTSTIGNQIAVGC